jgi:transposase-like protein
MRRYTDAERRAAVRDFERGDLSAAAFCRQRGFSCASLALWRRRYAPQRSSVPSAAAPWLPVVISDAGHASSARGVVYVMHHGTARLEVPSGFAAAEVRVLWDMIENDAAALSISRGS